MLRVCLMSLFALAALPPAGRAQDSCGEREPPPGPLVSAQWLRRHRSDSSLVVLHADRSRAVYDTAHISGARFVATGDITVTRDGILTELPPAERLDSLFESLGIGDRGRIVLYGEVLPVTRLFFTLDYLGLGDRVSVMNGGLEAWRAAGGAVTSAPPPAARPAHLTVRPDPTVLADAAWVESHRRDTGVVVLDVRTREEYDGTRPEEGVSRPGHIPGAVHLDWTTTIADGRFREGAELKQLLGGAGVVPGKEIVTYCRVGSRASAVYFVARLLGYRVRLYDGSMNEWSGKAELPVVKSPPPP